MALLTKNKIAHLIPLGLLTLIPNSALTAQEEKPNILFFYIDDLGWKDTGSYGSDFYETPAIDQLAMQGLRFTSSYQAAARCIPSRKSLFTGKYHERPEVDDSGGLSLEEYTFAEAFQDAGYHTFFTGKWHLGSDSTRYPDKQGFDVNKAGCNWGAPQGSTEGGGYYFSPYGSPTLTDGPEGEYITDRLTQETIDFINNHQTNQPDEPFLACVFHYAVHTPIEAPESYVAPYREKLNSMLYDRPEKEIDGPAKTNLRQDHPVYAGMIASVDESVRRIRESLDTHGLSDNTIIVFSTDHGGLSTTLKSFGRETATSNYPLRTGKGWLYEGGIRSPLIVYWPGVTEGNMITDELVVGMDIYPTLLEMAGLPAQPQQHLDGESFAPLVRGEEWSRSAPVMWYFPLAKTGTGNPNMAAVRVGEYKLIHFMNQDRFELYNIEKDIGESHNLASEKPELTEELKAILFNIEAETNMPAVSQTRIDVEVLEILPEYPTSISEQDYPTLKLLGVEEFEEDKSIIFTLNISEDNLYVHPVDLTYFYREQGDIEWLEINTVTGEHFRLLPGDYSNTWNYTGLEGKSIDIKIHGAINNELYPVKIGEVIIQGIKLFKKEVASLEVPEGRRIREIIADKYSANQLYVGATTGEWAFGEPNGEVMDREFNYVTPENDFKQSTVRSNINDWNWTKADAWLQHIIDHQQTLRIHGPISPQCSKWVKDDARTGQELELELSTFFTALCQRYNNVQNIKYMDVVNETVSSSGEWFGPKEGVDDWENPWTIIGFETDIPDTYPTLDSVPLYIIQAFEIANQHAPDIQLVLNQHAGMELAMWAKIKDLILYLRNEKGFRVDALGWQAHVKTGWEKEGNNMVELENLIDWCQTNNLEFHITEFDSWIMDTNLQDFDDQAATFGEIIKLLIKKSKTGTIGWNTWHISDAKGWKIERVPALFDILYNAKPAYYALQYELENGVYDTLVEADLRVYGKNENEVVPLKNASVLFNNLPGTTNDTGLVTFAAPLAEVSYTIQNKSYFPSTKNITIVGDTAISDTLIYRTFDVSIILLDLDSGSPIEDLEVIFSNTQKITDAAGEVYFPGVGSDHNDISIQSEFYSYHASLDFYSDTTIILMLELDQLTNYPIYFHVYNTSDGQAIPFATLIFDGKDYQCDNNGDLNLETTFGNYSYSASKDNFSSISAEVDFWNKDTVIAVPLTLLSARIKFVLTSEGFTLNDANIILNNQTETTNAIGMAYFDELAVEQNYSYTVTKDKYKDVQGDIFLKRDSTVNIEMELETSISKTELKPMLFPNPAYKSFTVNTQQAIQQLIIYDCAGRVVLEKKYLYAHNLVTDISRLEQGYFVVELKYADSLESSYMNLVVIDK